MGPTFPTSVPSDLERSSDAPCASWAISAQDLIRVQAALQRYRIPCPDRTDLAQDILLAVFEGRQKSGTAIVEPERWLNVIISNHVRRWRQRLFLELTRSEQTVVAEEVAIDETCNPEEFVMSEDRRRVLYHLYDQLPVDHLDAVIAREHYESTFEEIAADFEKPVSTVYGHYMAGMRELRAALERWKARHRDRGALLLPLTLEALFDADRTTPEPPVDEETERAWRRFQEAPRDPGRVSGAPASGPHPMQVPRFLGLSAALPVIGSVFAGQPNFDAVRSAEPLLESTSAPVAHAATPAAIGPLVSAPSTLDIGAHASAVAASVAAATAAPRLQTASGSHSRGRADSSVLITEQVMLEKARSAFIQGNMQASLTALAEYAQKCPGGLYKRERDSMWIGALVGLGRTSEACQRAESFRRAYPRSPLPAQLEPLCPRPLRNDIAAPSSGAHEESTMSGPSTRAL